MLETKAVPPASSASPLPRTIDAPQPLEVKSYMFKNFDYRTGPANPEDFFENLYVNIGEVGPTAAGSEANFTRTYSFYVTTPKALSSRLRTDSQNYKFGRNLLMVERYDMKVILGAVRDHINDLGLLGENID